MIHIVALLLFFRFTFAHEQEAIFDLLQRSNFNPPTCAENLSASTNDLGRYAARRFQDLIASTELNWIWNNGSDGRFESTEKWANASVNHHRFAPLYLSVLNLTKNVEDVKRWLAVNLHSVDMVLQTAQKVEQYEDGIGEVFPQGVSALAAYSSHPTLERTIEHDGLLILVTSNCEFDHLASAHDQRSAEIKDTSIYFLKGESIAEGLPLIRQTPTVEDSEDVLQAIRKGKILSLTKARADHNAELFFFADKDILEMRAEAAAPVLTRGEAPSAAVIHYAATCWMRALESQDVVR